MNRCAPGRQHRKVRVFSDSEYNEIAVLERHLKTTAASDKETRRMQTMRNALQHILAFINDTARR